MEIEFCVNLVLRNGSCHCKFARLGLERQIISNQYPSDITVWQNTNANNINDKIAVL